jgi:transglutaminase-like putative cysteine protease
VTAGRLVSCLLAAALAAIAGLAFLPVFAPRSLLPVVAVAAAGPAAIALLASRPGSPLWRSLALGAAGWLLAVCETLLRARTWHLAPAPSTAAAAVAALTHAWRDVLTTIAPLPDRPELLVPVHALVWAASLAGAELALRTRARLLPALPALLAFGAALPVAVGGAGSGVALAAAFVGAAAVMALARGGPWRLPSARTAPAVACLVLAAGLAGPRLPLAAGQRPFDPRQHLAAPPAGPLDGVDPLDEVSAWLLDPGIPLFTVRSPSPQNWRLLVLDRFDGATWWPPATFVPTGGRVPPAAGETGAGAVVDQAFVIQDLAGPWLPAADRPARLSGAAVDVDAGSGSLAAPGGLRPGLRYDVVSTVPRFTRAELRQATPAGLPAGTWPGIDAAAIRQVAREATAGGSFPFQQAVLLASYLRANYVFDATAPPGHSYRSLQFFLTVTRRGTSEQFATAYALLARSLGLPSRVVVGFGPGTPRGGGWQVDSGDVLVWPEIDFRGLGWVPFFPTPGPAAPGRAAQVAAGEPAARQQIDDGLQAAAPAPAARAVRAPRGAARSGPAPWWAAVPVAAGAGLAGGVAVLCRPAWRRRRRRGRPTPAGRVAGAWEEAVGLLRRVGLPRSGTLTTGDVAEYGARVVGAEAGARLRVLAHLADRADFAAEPVGDWHASLAWEHCDALAGLVGRGRR